METPTSQKSTVGDMWARIQKKLKNVDVSQMSLEQVQLAKIKVHHDLQPIQSFLSSEPQEHPDRPKWVSMQFPLLQLDRDLQCRFEDITYQNNAKSSRKHDVDRISRICFGNNQMEDLNNDLAVVLFGFETVRQGRGRHLGPSADVAAGAADELARARLRYYIPEYRFRDNSRDGRLALSPKSRQGPLDQWSLFAVISPACSN
jgi:hypothetical protein